MRIAANKTGDKSDKDNKSKDDTRKCGLSYFSESRVNVKFQGPRLCRSCP